MNESSAPLKSQLRSLFLLTGIFYLNFTARIIFSPLMPTVEKDLQIGHGEAGSLFFLISLGYFVSLIGSGFLSERLGHRKTIILSAVALSAALFGIPLSRGVWGVRVGLTMVGMAAGLYLPSAISTLTSLVSTRDWGKAIAVHELAPNLGFVTAPLVCEALLAWFSWRYVLVALGMASALCGIAFARFGKGGEFFGESPRLKTLRILLGEPSFWIMTFLFALGVSGSLGIYTMLPLYLIAGRHIERSWANYLVSLSRISGLFMPFVAGVATDRVGPRGAMAGVFLTTGFVTVLLGFVPGSWIVPMVFLQSMFAVCFFPAGFAALSKIGPPSVRNISVSFTVPVAFLLGGGAVPAVIGSLAERGFFDLGVCLVGAIILSGFVFSYLLKVQDK